MERGALSDLSDMPEADRILPEVQELVDQYADVPGTHERAAVLGDGRIRHLQRADLRGQRHRGARPPGTSSSRPARRSRPPASRPIYSTFKDPWTVGQGLFDYTVGGMVDVAEFYDQMRRVGTEVGPDSEVSFQKDARRPGRPDGELAEYSNDDAASRGYGDGNVAFANGEAAMYMQGPWALGEIAKTDPDLELGTFPLPMTDDPDDLKVRVNLDLALVDPRGEHPQGGRPRLRRRTSCSRRSWTSTTPRSSASAPRPMPRPVTDARILGMKEYYDEARFYQGASQADPADHPHRELHPGHRHRRRRPSRRSPTLDADWARLALRRLTPLTTKD